MTRGRVGEIILALLRARYHGGIGARVEEIPCADWDELVQLACLWRVAPLLYDTFHGPERRETVPPGSLERLRESYLGWAAKNAHTFHRLVWILAALREKGIPAIVLKGAHLAGEVYGNIALRPMYDVDLLVKSPDARTALETLVASGYQPYQGERFRSDTGCGAHLPYLSRTGWPIVDIHWTLSVPSKGLVVGTVGLWERARMVRIGDEETRALSPEDLLVHVGYHASAHGYADGPLFLCDVAEITMRWGWGIDWELAMGLAKAWGVSKSFYLAARMAAECLGGNIPLSEIERRRPPGIDEGVYLGLKARVLGKPHDMSTILTRLGPPGRWGRVVEFGRSAARSAFLSREAMSVMYGLPMGSRRCYIYYPVRWAELLVRYGIRRENTQHGLLWAYANIDRALRD